MDGRGARSEYNSVLSAEFSETILREFCVGGGLRTSSLRSIVWRILLKCLPVAKTEWLAIITRTREKYTHLKKQHIPDPHDLNFSQDPEQNNPLSDIEASPWKRFFADHDLRDIIVKDVNRTCPEIQYFQQEKVKSMMCDVLLIYSKENSVISYKQGMHEVLAPLLFVLFSDQQAYEHANETNELTSISEKDLKILNTIYDPQYLEHDSYTMFCEIMLNICKWYEDADSASQEEKTPFARVQDQIPTSAIMEELSSIDDRLYAEDPGLASHLKGLDIPPQLYGIRWLRLLFGREFPIHDLLYLWDVIVADQPIPHVCECIFVAMLTQIRELLLQSDYGGCLQYLMRYPPTVDISSFVQLVRHYRYPKKIPKPVITTQTNFTTITISGGSHPNQITRKEVQGMEEPPSAASFRPKSVSMLSRMTDKILEKPSKTEHPLFLDIRTLAAPSPSPQPSPKKAPFRPLAPSPIKPPVQFEKELQMMEGQVAILQSCLTERDVVSSSVSQQLETLSSEVLSANSDQSRRVICEKLKQLSRKLTTNYSNEDVSFFIPSSSSVELGKEATAKPAVRIPRMRRENEMMEFKPPR